MSKTEFNEYKITNAHMKWKGATKAEELGCTGSLELETELRTVTKKSEGDEVLSVDIPIKMTGNLKIHLPVETARKVFGLKTEGLKKGIFAYGTQSRQGTGGLTCDVLDIYDSMKKLIALPNMIFTGGFKWSLENGGEEIAELETTFKALKDSKNNFYYEALESEVTDANVKAKWHEEFTPELVEDKETEEKATKNGKVNA